MNATEGPSGGRSVSLVATVAAALAVLLVTALVWWLTNREDASEAGFGATGDDSGQVVEPDPGGGVPGDPGSAPPGGSVEDPPPADPGPQMTNPNGVPINGYVRLDDGRLALNYTTGVPECYGELDTPSVDETADTVTITLSVVPPAQTGQSCIELAVMKTVRVSLDAPLAGRRVLDGSFAGGLEVEEMAQPYE